MDTKFQTSFIPKRPVETGTAPVRAKHPLNLLSIIATFIFIVAVIAAGGEFAYKHYVNGKLVEMNQQLEVAKASIKDELINQFIRLDSRLRSSEQLLRGHVATSLLFSALQNSTVKNIQFSDMTYVTDQGSGAVNVFMRGISASYNAVALQASIFNDSKYIKNALFSDMNLDTKGQVQFTLKASVPSDVIAQRNTVQALTSTPQ